MKVLVIGGGASGLTAALTASEDPHSDVHLAERQARVARKLLATGNGRCNLTNRDMDLSHYHGTAPQFCLPALEAFGVEQTLAWFRSMGLLTVTEPGGRVYPASDSANSVADVLRLTLAGGRTSRCTRAARSRSCAARRAAFPSASGTKAACLTALSSARAARRAASWAERTSATAC